MAFQVTVRNTAGIQFDRVRQALDSKFDTAHDALSAAYYDYWRKGISHPWKGFDVQASPEESKILFDKLHGLLFFIYTVRFHQANMLQPLALRYDEELYRYRREPGGTLLEDKLLPSQATIDALQLEGISIVLD